MNAPEYLKAARELESKWVKRELEIRSKPGGTTIASAAVQKCRHELQAAMKLHEQWDKEIARDVKSGAMDRAARKLSNEK